MTMNTAWELQKSRGMRNRTQLLRQKQIDLAAREKKAVAMQMKQAACEKKLRQIAKLPASYEEVIPSVQQMVSQEIVLNQNQADALLEACARAEEDEKAMVEEEHEEFEVVEDFVTVPAKAVYADAWELVN